jgi:glycosyltransferase involved in cell wall biosynthesis
MIIYINARFLTRSVTGIERYCTELLKNLDSLIDSAAIDSKQFSFVMLAPKNIKHELNFKHIPLKCVGSLTGHLWEQLELPFYTRDGLLFSPSNAAPIFKCLQVVTIHDASFFARPQTYSFAFSSWYKFIIPLVGKVAKKIITVSSFSRKELVHYCKIKADKIKVVWNGKEQILVQSTDESFLTKNNIVPKRFVLAVSSPNPNKNFSAIIKAIKLLPEMGLEIVIVGDLLPKVYANSQVSFPNDVKYVSRVSDAELRALYEHAACFIYPSFYEGFGLPPLEAMACGCPVIVSNTSSLPEVCGDAALYCDPFSPEDIAVQVKKLVSNTALQSELKQKGLERAQQFSWEKCAWETFSTIKEVLDSANKVENNKVNENYVFKS